MQEKGQEVIVSVLFDTLSFAAIYSTKNSDKQLFWNVVSWPMTVIEINLNDTVFYPEFSN